jgi:hypothetical protein
MGRAPDNHPEAVLANDVDPLAGIEDEEFRVIEASSLSARHRQFVICYLQTHNAAKAARLCGYAKPYHHSAGAIMERPAVRELISCLLSNRMRRLSATPQRIEQELCKVAFANLGDILEIQADGTAYADFSKASVETLAAIKRFSCEVRQAANDGDAPREVLHMRVEMADKLGALEKLARIHRIVAGSDDAMAVAVDIAQAIRVARKRARFGSGEGRRPG